jgi:ATP-binding cassette, subfamily C, bacterial CydD
VTQTAGPAHQPRSALPRRRRGAPVDSRLVHHAGAARGYFATTVALGLVATALVLAQAGLLARALADPVRDTGAASLAGTLAVLLVVLVSRSAVSYGSETAALRAAATVKSQLRRRLTAHVLRLGPAWLARQRSGELVTLSTKGLDALDAYFARYLPQLLLAGLVPVAVVVTVTAADWLSGLVIAVTLPLIPVFGVLVGLHTKARTQRQWGLLARLGGHFLDVVEGLPTLKVFGRAKAQAEVIRNVTDEHRSATMAALRLAFLSALVLELAAALATAIVAVEVGLRLLAGHIGYETALLVLLLAPEAYLPLRNVGAQFHASAEGTAAADHVFELLDCQPPADSERASIGEVCYRPKPDLRSDAIELVNVTLSYPDRDHPALDGLCARIAPGQRVLVTGPNGAGKSSLLSLLLRFTEPTSGRIGLRGTSLDAVPVGWWRRQIAWVPQNPYLFAGTIAENIALGDPDAPPRALAAAVRQAGAEEFIKALPGGLHAPLSERGLNLSAGQRQRIALARAFLRDAPLVLLDEPTAHLDPVSAGQLLATLETLMAGRTVVLVTHRHNRSIPADQILHLDAGRLVSHGGVAAAQ